MGVMNIDKAEVACRFGRSIESYEEHAAVQREIAAHLAELATAYVTQPPRKILEVGCGTGLLTERILQLWAGSELWVNDLVEGMCAKAAARCRVPAAHCLVGDIESLPLPGAFDLVISASVFQWHVLQRLLPAWLPVFSPAVGWHSAPSARTIATNCAKWQAPAWLILLPTNCAPCFRRTFGLHIRKKPITAWISATPCKSCITSSAPASMLLPPAPSGHAASCKPSPTATPAFSPVMASFPSLTTPVTSSAKNRNNP